MIHTHLQTLIAEAAVQVANLLIGGNLEDTSTRSMVELGEPGQLWNLTTDLQITGRPAPPLEQQLVQPHRATNIAVDA